MNPELKYKDIVKTLGTMQGGIEYMALNQGASAQTRRYLDVRSVIDIDLSTIDNIANHNEATAIVKDLITFSNGAKLQLKFWFMNETISGNIVNGLTFKSVFTSAGGVDLGTPTGFTVNGLRPLGYNYNNNSYYGHTTVALLRQFGVKAVMSTTYAADVPFGSGIIEGVTKSDSLEINIFAPVITSEMPGTIRSWVQIVNGAHLNENFRYSITDPTDLYYPRITEQNSALTVLGVGIVARYTDLSTIKGQIGMTTDPYDTGSADDPTKPAQEQDPSKPGGGGGNYDPSSDPIDFPPLPVGGAVSSGAIKVFLVSPAILTSMFNILWDTNLFDIATQFQKLVTNPMDCIISLHCVPVIPTYGNPGSIKLGSFDTEVTAPVITDQYITIDCGSLTVPEFWGSALDYNPYCKVSISLPFVGIRDLNADDVINSTVHVKYNFDILTGDCVAFVKCGASVLYKFAGQAKSEIPVSGTTSNVLYKGLLATLSIAGGAVAGSAVGGAAGAAVGIASAAASVCGSKIISQRSGSLSGDAGLLDDFVPYLILHRQIQSLANGYNTQKGYTANLTRTLSSCCGYTEVEYVHLTGISGATDTELQEIEDLLKRGVII